MTTPGTIVLDVSHSLYNIPTNGPSVVIDISNLLVELSKKAPADNPIFTGTVQGLRKGMVHLSKVNNTSDLEKPISIATQEALDLKADKTYVDEQISNIFFDNSNNALDTIQEIANALNNDPNIVNSIINFSQSNFDASFSKLQYYIDNSLNMLRLFTTNSLNTLRTDVDIIRFLLIRKDK